MAVFRLILIAVEILVGIYVYCYIRRTMEFYGMDVRKIPFKNISSSFSRGHSIGLQKYVECQDCDYSSFADVCAAV